ncbi:NAD(P)-binding protein [Coniophora puteana RWD-64-598 SS2]|uniref:NAD(P)-binding protein n=1 Tax=Coniophora puteana (strain RWD-64-598) TaxID=741705 RepID=A0A5M3MX87_CONPW|nr:NAD(P)-binding protein [Coniophora puteana RWD-64-598 SS2]EIW83617.1 NAD(P)-binding protein [Coniophora puteana RWD-64-598 SS2]
MAKPTIFWLGATGYVGSEALLILNDYLPRPHSHHIVALVRNVTPHRESALTRLYSDIEIVEGTADDVETIQKTSERADVVINTCDSLHPPSVKAILAGLTTRAEVNAGAPAPIYVHVSGVSIISDRCNGDFVEEPTEWTDNNLDVHAKCVGAYVKSGKRLSHIAEASMRSEHPICTFVLNPALIYGIGAGIQFTTFWVRDWIERSKAAGYSGTFGEGANALSHIHVHDVVTALLIVLRAALDGKVQGGKDSNYFVGVSGTEQRAWAKVIGDCLYNKGLIKEAGCRPWPEAVTGPKDSLWWWAYAGNQIVRPDRLYALGWEPTETKKQGPIDSLPEAMEIALQMK